MRLFVALLCFVLACFSQAQTQDASDLLALAVKELPPCALACTITTIGASDCELTNITCIKSNKKLQDTLSACVKSSCTIKQSLTAKAFLQTLLGAKRRNKERLGTLTTLIAGGAAVIAYLLRVVARTPYGGSKWGNDDWAITAAMVFVVPLTICAYSLNQIGMGKDMWFVPFDNITKILEIFYFTELLYLAGIGLTKISILLFYLRIFPDQKLRRIIYGAILVCLLYIVIFVTATALQCIPVSIAWKKWDGEHHGKCLNLNADGWASASTNIILDLIVMIIPMKQLKNLAMSWPRKLGIMVMFLGGGFVTIVSILRLEFLIQFAHTDNVTWDYLPVGYWSAVEAHVGVMVACAPAIRSLQRHVRDRIYPKPASAASYYDSENNTKNSNGNKGGRSKVASQVSSRMWSSKQDRGRKESFVEIDEYEMNVGSGFQSRHDDDGRGRNSPLGEVSEGSTVRSFASNEDIMPLASTAAPIAQHHGVDGIMVQTDYTVGRDSRNHGL